MNSEETIPEARPAGRPGHPLGPRFYRQKSAHPNATRSKALAVLMTCLGLLAVAVLLKPDARGYGTHRALGLPDCAMVQMTGYPCPTCGMTTAFALGVRGHWVAAFDVQPTGFLLFLIVLAVAGVSTSVLISGRSWRINWYRVSPGWHVALLVLLLLAGWAYKIGRGVLDGSLPAR